MNELGKAYEAMARRHLEAAGLRLLAANYATRFGEIDLVMRDHDVLVFAEVRYRASARFGGAAASVTAAKCRKLATAAEQYRQANPALARLPCRFDLVALEGDPRAPSIEWLRAAFEPA